MIVAIAQIATSEYQTNGHAKICAHPHKTQAPNPDVCLKESHSGV